MAAGAAVGVGGWHREVAWETLEPRLGGRNERRDGLGNSGSIQDRQDLTTWSWRWQGNPEKQRFGTFLGWWPGKISRMGSEEKMSSVRACRACRTAL